MTTLSLDNLADFSLCDAKLLGITWVTDGRDLCLDLILGGGERAHLVLSFAKGLVLEIRQPEGTGGYLLSWQAEFAQVLGGWNLSFDFASVGCIKVSCKDVSLTKLGAV